MVVKRENKARKELHSKEKRTLVPNFSISHDLEPNYSETPTFGLLAKELEKVIFHLTSVKLCTSQCKPPPPGKRGA